MALSAMRRGVDLVGLVELVELVDFIENVIQ